MSTIPSVQKALGILGCRKDRWTILNRIQSSDPYVDKRFTPVIARWVVDHDITPEEHAEDVVRFKKLRQRLKKLRTPATNHERKKYVSRMLLYGPEDFISHYSHLQLWNATVSDALDFNKDLSDEGLPVVMRHDGYTMYRIDKREHCRVPLVENTMSWCVVREHFGGYNGPPYYPIVRDHDKKPFCMVIPAHFDTDPDQAVRNANNDGRISPRDLKLIRPLLRHVLPLEEHNHPYIKGVHGIKPNDLNMGFLYTIREYALQPGDWPEGEELIARDASHSYCYAKDVVGGRWTQGEGAICENPDTALMYVKNVIRGPLPAVEHSIASDPATAFQYARDILNGAFPAGEPAIARNDFLALKYAQAVLKGRFPLIEQSIFGSASKSFNYARCIGLPFPDGEEAIASDAEMACLYSTDVLKGRFFWGEKTISGNPRWAYYYALDIIKDRWPDGEDAIGNDPFWAYMYACYVLNRPFAAGEPAIAKDPKLSYNYVTAINRHSQVCLDAVAQDPECAYKYAFEEVRGPWPRGEHGIAKDARHSYNYASHILKGRFPLGEDVISKSEYSTDYDYLLQHGPFKYNENTTRYTYG